MKNFLIQYFFFSNRNNIYFFGWIWTLMISIVSFIIAKNYKLFKSYTFFVLLFLCILQIISHLIFFFDIKKFSDLNSILGMFFFSLLVICIIISGSIWIMHNLDCYHFE
ncbi:Cytochrome bo(3) ubiquinol oxidase subunit 4 [Buchnera aphidicola (Thelaxes suberi)]|uniref:hypothetical protein n=1 Tax=Buchnera aphidicola TaxID=9 RepID=UPI003464C45F